MPADALPLPALQAFEAAARHGSFTRAATELGLTQAAVSYHVKRLEERLGTPLFVRRGRGLRLTEAGERLAGDAVEAFGRLRAAVGDETGAAASRLTIMSVPVFATHWLAPRLGRFQAAAPGLTVQLTADTSLIDRIDDTLLADIEVRAGSSGFPPRLVAHRLLDVHLTVVVSPPLAAALRSPADLAALPLIGQEQSWDAWLDAAGVDLPAAARRRAPTFDSQATAMRAIAAGVGAGLVTPAFFADDLESGRLVAPFPITVDRRKGYWLIHAAEHRHRHKIRAFVEWARGEAAGDARRGAGATSRRPADASRLPSTR
jgi:LysR family glycine cleavage system transcriptional activator